MGDFATFVGGSYKSQSPVTDQEDLINWYVEASESPGASAQASLYPTPGFELFTAATATGGRGMFFGITTADQPTQVGHCFAVFGNAFEEVLADASVVHRGVVAVDENPATICTNGYGSDSALPDDQEGLGQLFVTSGGKGYIYELATDTLTLIPDLDDPDITVTQGACLNGHFLAFDRDRSVIYVSDQLDGMSWDLSNYIQRQIGTDPWRAMIATPYGQLCLPGQLTGEFWYFDPVNYPTLFSPDLSGLFSYGCGATFSVAQLGDSVVWLGKAPDGGYQVLQARGYRPARISTHAMEHEAATYPRIDDAIGQCYTEQGHTFYLLTFPTANVTWCYDESAPEGRRWHKRGTWISEQGIYSYLRPVFHAFAFDKHLMADRETNRIYHMANRFPRDIDSRVIRRLRRSPTVQNENALVVYREFELLMETGLGQDANPHGPPPTVMLRISKDGGRTWGDERQASAGKLGAFQTRVYWPRIGQARQRVFEVTVTDAVRNWRVTAAYLRVPGGQ